MEQTDQREKTLVFCATQDHARSVRDLINQMKTSTDPNYCQRVTANDGALGEQHLRNFQNNDHTIPTILTTSQKLSTGVDARNVRNIVLMHPINSMIEFKQMIGRGTRLYDGNDYFTIYDIVKAYIHFSEPEWDGEPLVPEPGEKCGFHPCQCVKTCRSCAEWSEPSHPRASPLPLERHRHDGEPFRPLVLVPLLRDALEGMFLGVFAAIFSVLRATIGSVAEASSFLVAACRSLTSQSDT
jgi:type I restriction enzyme R subunit